MWEEEPFTRGQAWVDLLLITNYEDGYYRNRGERIDLQRGQCGRSVLSLSERWKWSRGKTTRFLKELEKDGRILIKTDNRNTIISICNYDKFQCHDTADDTTDDTTDGHETIQQTDTNKKEKKNKETNNPPLSPQGAKPKRAKNLKMELGDDLVPPGEWADFCKEDMFKDEDWAWTEYEKFRDYHLARGSVMKDWFAAWRTWTRNAIKFEEKKHARF